MRTTLDIDEDVLLVAKEIAQHRKQSLGKVISEIFRGNLQQSTSSDAVRNGVHIVQRGPGAKIVTMEYINKLRDELP